MKKLQNTLTVGKELQGLDLYASIKMDGQELQRFKCDSFVGNFPHLLQALFHGGYVNVPKPMAPHNAYGITEPPTGIDNASNASPIEVNLTETDFLTNWQDNEDIIWIWGVQGNTAANGYFTGVKVDSDQLKLYDLDGNPVAGNGAYTSGGKAHVMGFRDWYPMRMGNDGEYWGELLQHWQVIVGANSDATHVNDYYLKDRIPHGSNDGQLSHGSRSISAIVTDKPSSRFTISKPFTNQGTTDITVSEIGITSQGSDYNNNGDFEGVNFPGLLMVRDTLGSSVTIPAGKTLTVDYELVIQLSPDTQDTETDGTNGGFIQNFMYDIRSMAVGGNNTQGFVFNMAVPSGHMGGDAASQTGKAYDFGIRVGTDNTYVSMTDTDCKGPIAHGDGAGQLWYYGMNVEEVVRDTASNKAYFKVNRIVENRTGNSITIGEIALFGNNRENNAHSNGMYSACIARTALKSTDQITIAAGEFAQIEYTIEIIV
ncbi:hypothetical protein [Halalkalibaculum sp. DA384]|uniref:hypothetical protein n=1 Tax=Halalkalibaculum sp. DA384 TaxID=3373606 RepID=UPI0037551C83